MKTPDGFVVSISILERMKDIYAVMDEDEKAMCPNFKEMMEKVIERWEREAIESARRVCKRNLMRQN